MKPRLYETGSLVRLRKIGDESWQIGCVMISNRATRTLAIDLEPGGPTILLMWMIGQGWVRLQNQAEAWAVEAKSPVEYLAELRGAKKRKG